MEGSEVKNKERSEVDSDVWNFPKLRHRIAYKKSSLGHAIDKATLGVLKEVYESQENKNVVCSPLGVLTLLAMVRATASVDVKQELNKLLDGPHETELSHMYQTLSERLSGMDAAVLSFVNKICVSHEYTLTEEFNETVKAFSSEVDTVNFEDPKTAEDINEWANKKTQGHIQNAVEPGALKDQVTALFNVIFFQGHWDVPFKKKNTKDKKFHIDAHTTVKKPTMLLAKSLYYTDYTKNGFRMVELPYQEEGFRALVILPNEIDGLPAVLDWLAIHGVLSVEANLRMSGVDVILDLPKFEVTSDLNFERVVRKMGVNKIFDQGSKGIVHEKPVKVSKIFQKAFIKVDEEGATAGAFTGICYVPMSAHYVSPPAIRFKVDHPFLYLIMFEDKILFAGTYTH